MRKGLAILAVVMLASGVLGGLSLFGGQATHESCPFQMGVCLDEVGHLRGFDILFASLIASLTLLLVPRLFSGELKPQALRLSFLRRVRCVVPVRYLKWLALLEKRDPEGMFAGA